VKIGPITLSMGTATTVLASVLAIGIGLVDSWAFHSQLVGKESQITDLSLVLMGVAGLLGHNPMQTVSQSAQTAKSL